VKYNGKEQEWKRGEENSLACLHLHVHTHNFMPYALSRSPNFCVNSADRR